MPFLGIGAAISKRETNTYKRSQEKNALINGNLEEGEYMTNLEKKAASSQRTSPAKGESGARFEEA